MKLKPPGKQYRNLAKFRDRIFYSRTVAGRRYWVDFKTQDWTDAALMRDRFEELEGIEKRRGDIPTLETFARRYLREDTSARTRTWAAGR